VFGRESSGLSNDELGRCSALLTIPTANDFSSLNLGAAVQVICYEVMMAGSNPGAASGPDNGGDDSDAPAQQGEIEGFYQHMTEAMTRVDFFNPENPRLLEGRLRRLFNRSGLLKSEVQLLRGFFAAIEKKVR
jgi:TrmH family RNA methyltransferase